MERLDDKIHQLEDLHVIEDIPDRDIFGLTDEFSIVNDRTHPELTASSNKKSTRALQRIFGRDAFRKERDRKGRV